MVDNPTWVRQSLTPYVSIGNARPHVVLVELVSPTYNNHVDPFVIVSIAYLL